MSPEELRRKWLVGTTCAQKARDPREVLFANATHIVLCHRAHAEYTGRMSGTTTCRTYARLYVISELVASFHRYGGMSAPFLKEWTGRLNVKAIRKECADLGIVFEDATAAA